ncbi:34ee5738-046b-40e9-b279-eb631b46c707 [Sclerotinia trifoliorum]|uniref:34ee5738-046b-40e9-b279-eb631b46c707 n=1 Tax=Sclerotinia trifoliorum TaxID=28548 RepID=A0A8H2ZUS2_9HELO|nr:34ee5738-046b-40e9-b279-eb631b46c707 [Sclerotinia trifoliorum]
MEDYDDMDDFEFEEEVDIEEEEEGEGDEEAEGIGMIEENEDEDGDYDYDDEEEQSAPIYTIPPREIVAVEHPLIVKNLENGIKTFGRQPQWNKILEGTEDECIPLFLRTKDPTCEPILSYNSITNNVLLKITVPKCTGRKRKRGSQDPYTDDGRPASESTIGQNALGDIRSHSLNDKPASILRKLRDNVGKYTVEAAGAIEQSHRYRGLSDYHQSTSHAPFMSHFKETAFSANWGKMREFKLGTDKGWKPNEEIIPPPTFTHHPLPFNWGYRQNPLISTEVDAETGETSIVNRSKMPKLEMQYVHCDEDEDVPTKPFRAVPDDPVLKDFVTALQQAMNERPIWTRRALQNRLANEPGYYLMKPALQYVGYQFRSGPWRDALIRYGVDPRKDPSCRIYQTIFFKLYEEDERAPDGQWKDMRSQYTKHQVFGTGDCPSHMFNGTSLTLDGKVWQICDITDPLLVPIIQTAPMAKAYDNNHDGYYNNGTLAKIRAIMKTKLIAIRSNKVVPENAFDVALSIPDYVEGKDGKKVHVPVPDMRLTDEEIEKLREKGIISGMSGKGVRHLDSRSKRKKYRKGGGKLPTGTKRAKQYGMMKGPSTSKPKTSVSVPKPRTKDTATSPDNDVTPDVTGVGATGDISTEDTTKMMDDTWVDTVEGGGGEIEAEVGEEGDEEAEENGEELVEAELGSENESTGSEDESEAEKEKEMFIKNYEARKVAGSNDH